MLTTILLLGALSATLAAPLAPSVDCTRDGLLATANAYLAAQTAGKLDSLTLEPTFTYQENNKAIDTKKGLLNTALKLDLSRSAADTTACASYSMFVSSTGAKPYVVATQIRHVGNDTASISMIDSIVATTGSLFFNASLTLSELKAEDWTTVPATLASRETLKKYGDAYLDMWTDSKAADSIKWGKGCERVEGSKLTKPGCGTGLPHGGSTKPNGNRRYVVDEVMGTVDVLCSFDSLGNMPDSHEIRVLDGMVRYVHTVTVSFFPESVR